MTGTIARTATNVRAGATSPVSGMLHAVLRAGLPAGRCSACEIHSARGARRRVSLRLLQHDRKTGDRRPLPLVLGRCHCAFSHLPRRHLPRPDGSILVGFVLGAFLFIERMAKHVQVSEQPAISSPTIRKAREAIRTTDPDTAVYRISGVFFFGAAATVASVLDRIADRHKNFILDCSSVPFMDSSAAKCDRGRGAQGAQKWHPRAHRRCLARRALNPGGQPREGARGRYLPTFKEAAAAVQLQPPRFARHGLRA